MIEVNYVEICCSIQVHDLSYNKSPFDPRKLFPMCTLYSVGLQVLALVRWTNLEARSFYK